MANNPEFRYAPMFQLGKDETEYYKLTSDYVSVGEFEGKPILKIEPEALTMLAQQAFRDVNFLLRRSHNEQVAKILRDPEASDNDKYVALTFLRNSEVAAKGVLPTCQDTGTAVIIGKKGQYVFTEGSDEEALSHPDRHVLMNALGIFPSLSLAFNEFEYQGETILCCSDGLYNQVPLDEMANILSTDERCDQKADSLIAIANSNGGSDNIAVALWECISND